jgi:hypothetical protein
VHTVTIEDVLVRLHTFMGMKANYLYTGRELYEQIMAPAKRMMVAGTTRVYVALFDNQQLVPQRKWGTQKKRDAQRNVMGKKKPKAGAGGGESKEEKKEEEEEESIPIEGYKEDFLIHDDEGILYTVSGKKELLDIRRLMKTREARRVLCMYIASKLMKDEFDWGSSVFIFDFADLSDGPVMVTGGGRRERLPAFIHFFGEADMMAGLWSWVFRDYDQVLISTDTDWIPILTLSTSRRRPDATSRVLLQQKPGMFLDIMALGLALTSIGLTAKSFLLLCILGGTDFHAKGSLFRGVAFVNIIPTLIKSASKLDKVIIPVEYVEDKKWPEHWEARWSLYLTDNGESHGVGSCIGAVQTGIRQSIRQFEDDAKRAKAEEKKKSSEQKEKEMAEGKKPKRKMKPRVCTHDDLSGGIDSVLWNMQYWGFNWNNIGLEPPVELSISLRKRKSADSDEL